MKSILNVKIKTLCTVALFSAAVMAPAGALLAQPETTTAASQQQACACFEVKVVGQGPAVILIPGVASSGEVWQSTVDALKADYQLHVLTLAGFAGVKPIPMQSWGDGYLAIQQQAILRYISEQQLEKPVIVGHSLGGYLALALAANAPEQIGGAVNVDGLPALGAMFSQAAASNNTGQQQPQRFDPMAMAKSMATAEDWQQRIVSNMMSSDGQTSGRVMGELMRADLRGQLANIRVPVLTLGALQNGAPYSTPEQVQQNYENQLADAPAQYHSFAFARDSKHFIMADAPEWLNQQIGRFLSQRGKE
ncbi:alpha/beta hydrolase [Arsukibacterium sp.]|uniref:alpha/beta fold hydrolase n=1 Tax=Arsukibacterium sp. TaxID=1977258 RepID=UPI00299D4C1D|nr:alpha/beta hydrolase [Arsukibacterium sp.]MDX1537340.1 alpha/beta hydrolase [Arsukibacterium sp.]